MSFSLLLFKHFYLVICFRVLGIEPKAMFIILGKWSATEFSPPFSVGTCYEICLCLEASSYPEQMLLSVPRVLVSLIAGLSVLTCEAHTTRTCHSPSPSHTLTFLSRVLFCCAVGPGRYSPEHMDRAVEGRLQLTWWLCFLVSRLEERESEMKKEYNALHQRHTEVGTSGFPEGMKVGFNCYGYTLPFAAALWSLLLPSLCGRKLSAHVP